MPTKLAYDVEHIIDNNGPWNGKAIPTRVISLEITGPEYENCNKDIVANYVMVNNYWNLGKKLTFFQARFSKKSEDFSENKPNVRCYS